MGKQFFVIASVVIVCSLIFTGIYFGLRERRGEEEKKPAVSEEQKSPAPSGEKRNGMHTVTIETTHGVITFSTFDVDAPKTVENFISLAEKKFYDGLTFHRVIKGFMIQGGDPFGNGTGGPGYTFEDELDPAAESYQNGYKRGAVAMANAGPDTNGSQFFIMHQDYPLPHNYTIFGKVIEGIEVVDAIVSLQTNEQDMPLIPVVIKSIEVELR